VRVRQVVVGVLVALGVAGLAPVRSGPDRSGPGAREAIHGPSSQRTLSWIGTPLVPRALPASATASTR
jgi:hypothetical protein